MFRASMQSGCHIIKLVLVILLLGAFSPPAQAAIHSCDTLLRREFKWLERHYSASELSDLKKLDPTIQTLVVVDGLSSGANYAVRARELFPRINIIHIQTAKRMAFGLLSSFDRSQYDANLVFTRERLSDLALQLSPFKSGNLKVVAGTETSPHVRGILAKALGLPSGSVFYLDALNNKELQAEAVSRFVRTIPGRSFTSASAAWSWATSEEVNLQFPMMIKPVDAAGSFGVTPVDTKEEFFEAFRVVGRMNPLGRKTAGMLVQPYLSRELYTEFVIDAVIDPETGVTLAESLKYKKQESNGTVNYLTTRLVNFELPEYSFLYEPFLAFAEAVAAGLEYQEGVLHIEVFVRNGSNPPEIIFIEAGARPAGGGIPMFARACDGPDMITLHLLALFDRPQFLTLAREKPVFQKEGIQIELLGPKKTGIVLSVPTDEEFRRSIPGFHSHSLHLKRNVRTGPSEDLFQGAGVINVVGTAEHVDNAEAATRAWEDHGDLYRTRPVTFWDRLLRR